MLTLLKSNLVGALKRTFENPNTPLSDPAEWLSDLAGGGVSKSGIRVSHKAALKLTAVWRGINVLSTDVSKVPLHVYKRLKGGGKERATTHPSYRLMRRQPHEVVNILNFLKSRMAHAILRGNGFGWIQRNEDGEATEILPVAPGDVTRARTDESALTYLVVRDGRSWRVPHTDMWHIRGLADDGIWGYDLIDVGREAMGLSLAANRFASSFFANNATASVTLTHDKNLTKEAKDKLAESWIKAHAGVDNAHKVVILEEGVKIEKISVDADAAQLMELRAFELIDIANLLGVPPHKLGDASRKAHASLEQEARAYRDESLNGWLCAIEAESNDKLLTEKQKRQDSHFFEFNRAALLSVDHVASVTAMLNEVREGTLNADEARAMQNRGPIPDGMGTKFRIPLNTGFVGETPVTDGTGKTPPLLKEPKESPVVGDDDDDDEDDDARSAHRDLFADAFTRMLKRITLQVQRCKTTDAIAKFLDEKLDNQRRVVRAALDPACRVACRVNGVVADRATTEVVELFFRAVRNKIETTPPADLATLPDSWAMDAAILAERASDVCHPRS